LHVNLKKTSLYLFILTLLVSYGAGTQNANPKNIEFETLSHLSHTNVDKNDEVLKVTKQLSLLHLTLSQLEQQNIVISDKLEKSCKSNDEFMHIEKSRFLYTKLKSVKKLSNLVAMIRIEKPNSSNSPNNFEDFDYIHAAFTIIETPEIDNQLPTLQLKLDKFKKQDIANKYIENSIYKPTHIEQQKLNQVYTNTIQQIPSLTAFNKKNDVADQLRGIIVKEKYLKKSISIDHIGYWQTVHSIESKQGKLLYRPRNKSRNCTYTSGPCGHHQLTIQALKDIGCNSLQCRKDRLNYKKSLTLSKKLLALNEKRLRKNGISKLEGYQKYLIHQQGAYGIKNIIAATNGKKVLSKKIKKNMANNSPYSYKQLKNMGSKTAAKKFMQHWENKWVNEKRLIVASQKTTSTDSLINTNFIPTFDDIELNFALNIRF